MKLTLDFVPGSAPEQAGFDSGRMQQVSTLMADWVQGQQVAGAVAAVVRTNQLVFSEVHGYSDLESRSQLQPDAIFQLASMTKPVISVAILRLLDEGKLGLHDPIRQYLPAFSNMQVALPVEPAVGTPADQASATAAPGTSYTNVPARRDITIADLLCHSSGMGQGAFSEAQWVMPALEDTLESYVPRLAEIPLDFQPGSQTGYSAMAGFDVLGRIVEIVSGQALDRYLNDAIFQPLGMVDTTFTPTPAQRERIVTLYTSTPEGLAEIKVEDYFPFAGTGYFSGAGGLYGTLADYLRFALMLVNKGEWAGKRILKAATVTLMGSSLLPEELRRMSSGQEWGCGVRVITDAAGSGTPLSLGSFGWSGAWSSHFWIDPQLDLAAVLLINCGNLGGSEAFTSRQFEDAVMQAVE